jgi:hypothetical protein
VNLSDHYFTGIVKIVNCLLLQHGGADPAEWCEAAVLISPDISTLLQQVA